MPTFPDHVIIGDETPLPLEGVDQRQTKENLKTGEKIVQISSKPLSQLGREEVLFRVVGDSSLGWTEAAVSWGGTIDGLFQSQNDNN